jgi:nucleotide-binding universal stress UspA family protein
MTANPKAAFTIVVGTDFGVPSGYAFDQAAYVARRIPGSHVHVVHVSVEPLSAERSVALAKELRRQIENRALAIDNFAGQSVGIHVRIGRPAREIAQLATDVGADLIVVGSKGGTNLKSLFTGSVSERLVASAPCPVFIAGPMPKTNEHEPVIEAPCADCIAIRAKTKGHDWWCTRHAHHAAAAHTYSYQREFPFAQHDSEVIPTGVKMS